MKKLLSVVLVLVMMLSVFSVTASAVPSENLLYWDVHENGLYYTVYDDGEAIVEGFDEDHAKTNPNLVIPSTIKYDDNVYTVTYIGESAFLTSEYKTITLPSTIYFVGYEAFAGSKNLEKVIIPNDCEFTYFNANAFSGTPFEAEIFSNEYTVFGKNTLFSYAGSGEFTIPENITYIVDQCFMMSGLEKINFNDKLRDIPFYSFSNCTELKEVVIPDSVENIETGAFAGCTNLANVTLGDNVSYIGVDAFAYTAIKSIHLTRSVSELSGAFRNCKYLENITVDVNNSTLTTDGKAVYQEASFYFPIDIPIEGKTLVFYLPKYATGKITLPNDVLLIAAYAFYGYKDLEEVSAKDVALIDDGAFSGSGIKSFNAKNLFVVGNKAFANCKNLSKIDLSYTYAILASAFEGCTSLKDVELAEDISTIGGMAFANTGITEITITGSNCIIDEGAFMNCKNLKKVTIGDGVTDIYANVFLGCTNLKTVSLSKNIEYLDENAFNGCENVTFEVIKNSYAHRFVKNAGLNFEIVGKISFWQRIIDFFRSIFGF